MIYDEKTFGLYMMFKVKDNSIVAWKEGNSKEIYSLRGENLDIYLKHLDESISKCQVALDFTNNNDIKALKRMEKLKLYKKRLENEMSKIKVEVY